MVNAARKVSLVCPAQEEILARQEYEARPVSVAQQAQQAPKVSLGRSDLRVPKAHLE